MQPCQEQNKSFFDQLQNIEGLDLRDTRGLRHELRIVLLGVTMAILSNRDGNLSSIHRYIVNHNTRILASINYSLLLLKQEYGKLSLEKYSKYRDV